MIDKSGEYWTGDSAEDINEYLCCFAGKNDLEIKTVRCSCGCDIFEATLDTFEKVIKVKCDKCGAEKFLLDSEDYWEEAKPEVAVCPICNSKKYNFRIGFIRRITGEVMWVYMGNRCTKCNVLGSYMDFGINYGPTTEMEKNI